MTEGVVTSGGVRGRTFATYERAASSVPTSRPAREVTATVHGVEAAEQADTRIYHEEGEQDGQHGLKAREKALVTVHAHPYTGPRSGGRVVEGTPLLRVQAGNRLEGSNPFHSATCLRESVLPIQLRPDFLVVFEGYAGGAVNLPRCQEGR